MVVQLQQGGTETTNTGDSNYSIIAILPLPISSSTPRKRKKEATGATPSSSGAAGDSDEPDSRAPPSKKRKKLLCKYGAKCYQTSARHREQFDHPWHEAETHKLECADIKVEDVSSGQSCLLPTCTL